MCLSPFDKSMRAIWKKEHWIYHTAHPELTTGGLEESESSWKVRFCVYNQVLVSFWTEGKSLGGDLELDFSGPHMTVCIIKCVNRGEEFTEFDDKISETDQLF